MMDNYTKYFKEADPYEDCYNWFWNSLETNDTNSKEFLEDLMEILKKFEDRTEELTSFSSIEELVDNLHIEDYGII